MLVPQIKNRSLLKRYVLNPKFVLPALAIWNLLAVPQRFTGLCFYNWRDAFDLAVTIFAAAVGLLLTKWWGYIGALILSGTVVYDFGYVLLKVFGFIAKSDAEAESYPAPAVWWNVMQQHPEEWLQVVLAVTIFFSAAMYLGIGTFEQFRRGFNSC